MAMTITDFLKKADEIAAIKLAQLQGEPDKPGVGEQGSMKQDSASKDKEVNEIAPPPKGNTATPPEMKSGKPAEEGTVSTDKETQSGDFNAQPKTAAELANSILAAIKEAAKADTEKKAEDKKAEDKKAEDKKAKSEQQDKKAEDNKSDQSDKKAEDNKSDQQNKKAEGGKQQFNFTQELYSKVAEEVLERYALAKLAQAIEGIEGDTADKAKAIADVLQQQGVGAQDLDIILPEIVKILQAQEAVANQSGTAEALANEDIADQQKVAEAISQKLAEAMNSDINSEELAKLAAFINAANQSFIGGNNDVSEFLKQAAAEELLKQAALEEMQKYHLIQALPFLQKQASVGFDKEAGWANFLAGLKRSPSDILQLITRPKETFSALRNLAERVPMWNDEAKKELLQQMLGQGLGYTGMLGGTVYGAKSLYDYLNPPETPWYESILGSDTVDKIKNLV